MLSHPLTLPSPHWGEGRLDCPLKYESPVLKKEGRKRNVRSPGARESISTDELRCGLADHRAEFLDDLVHQRGIVAFRHDADQGLGARWADQ